MRVIRVLSIPPCSGATLPSAHGVVLWALTSITHPEHSRWVSGRNSCHSPGFILRIFRSAAGHSVTSWLTLSPHGQSE